MRKTILSLSSIALLAAAVIAAAKGQQGNTQPAQAQPGGRPQAGPLPERKLGSTPDEKAILEGIAAFAKAYDAANAAAIADLFLDESMIVTPDGSAIRGKAAIAEMYGAAFKDNPGLKLEPTVEDIRLVPPTSLAWKARPGSRARTAMPRNLPASVLSWLAATGSWRIAEMHEYAAPAADVTPTNDSRSSNGWLANGLKKATRPSRSQRFAGPTTAAF